MRQITTAIFGLVLIAGCTNTPAPSSASASASSVAAEPGKIDEKWRALERFSPRYPIKRAIQGKEGCATIEYVVTPDYQIYEPHVISATDSQFADSAKAVVSRWKWAGLPKGIISKPIKVQTRFEFCLQSEPGQCSMANLKNRQQCSGEDIVAAVGQRMSD